MIEGNEFGYTVCCDCCANYEELDCSTIYDAIEEMRFLGWRPFKVNSEWLHRCPVCIEDGVEYSG